MQPKCVCKICFIRCIRINANTIQLVILSSLLLFSSLYPPLKVDSAGLLCEEVQQYPVLNDKQMKGVREKDALSNVWNAGTKNLEFIENGKSNLI